MKRGGPLLWLILAVAAGLAVPAVVVMVKELTGDGVPEVNPLFIGGIALAWLAVVGALAAICIAQPRRLVRIPILVMLLVPYGVVLGQLSPQGVVWSLVRPDMASGDGYFDAKADRELAAAIVACDVHDEPPHCDFPRIDALARLANVNAVGRRGKTFMDLALAAGGFPAVVGSLLRAGETAGNARAKAMGYACEQAQPELARAVLAAGVDPNLRTSDGRPYLLLATAIPDGLAAFLEAGADVNAQSPDGQTALLQAVRSLQFKSVALLLALGAREDQVAKDGTTLDKLMADVPPEMLKDLPPEVDAFVKRHRPR